MKTATARRLRRVLAVHDEHRNLLHELARSNMAFESALRFGPVFNAAARAELPRRDYWLYAAVRQRSASRANRRMVRKLNDLFGGKHDGENNPMGGDL